MLYAPSIGLPRAPMFKVPFSSAGFSKYLFGPCPVPLVFFSAEISTLIELEDVLLEEALLHLRPISEAAKAVLSCQCSLEKASSGLKAPMTDPCTPDKSPEDK
ncbi:hypothetical protein D3C77_689610 [compost metagenome]